MCYFFFLFTKYFSDKIFVNALIVSCVLHLTILINWPIVKRLSVENQQKLLEVTYYTVKKAPIDSKLIKEKNIIKKKPSVAPKILEKSSLSKQQKLEPLALKDTDNPIRVKLQKLDKPDMIRHISNDTDVLISHKEKDLSKDPTYITYYNSVRAKLYKSANANKSYYFMEGDIKIAFTLRRDGTLVDASIIQEQSTRNPILQKHALMSIQRALPFEPFHTSIKEDQLTLRVTISFEK